MNILNLSVSNFLIPISFYQCIFSFLILYISIIMQIIFLSIINLIVGEIGDTNKQENIATDFKYRKVFVFALQLTLVIILIYHLINAITYNTTLFEYSILLFILAFYYSKGDKKNKIITEIILVIFSLYSLLVGERIAVLQFLIVDFIINYLEKFKIKYIILCMVLGIFIFT